MPFLNMVIFEYRISVKRFKSDTISSIFLILMFYKILCRRIKFAAKICARLIIKIALKTFILLLYFYRFMASILLLLVVASLIILFQQFDTFHLLYVW